MRGCNCESEEWGVSLWECVDERDEGEFWVAEWGKVVYNVGGFT